MNIEFHYYTNLLIAATAGFSLDESYIIAHSSQYVDDNHQRWAVLDPCDSDSCYFSQITQNYDMKIAEPLADRLYLTLHFIPGNAKQAAKLRIDGQYNQLAVTPNSFRARQGMRLALNSGDPYRIGIASHAFADTWAHQNFVGRHDRFNICRRLTYHVAPYFGKRLLPIGHVNVLDQPDLIGGQWEDMRLKQNLVDNNRRFLAAAYALYQQYRRQRDGCGYGKGGGKMVRCSDPGWKVLQGWLRRIFSAATYDERYDLYHQALLAITGQQMREYDREVWRRQSITPWNGGVTRKVAAAVAEAEERSGLKVELGGWCQRGDRRTSDWYRFQMAAVEHIDGLWPLVEKRLL